MLQKLEKWNLWDSVHLSYIQLVLLVRTLVSKWQKPSLNKLRRKMEFIGLYNWEGQGRHTWIQRLKSSQYLGTHFFICRLSLSLLCIASFSKTLPHGRDTAINYSGVYLWFKIWRKEKATSLPLIWNILRKVLDLWSGSYAYLSELPQCPAGFDIMISPSWVRCPAVCAKGEWGKVLTLLVPPGLWKDSEGVTDLQRKRSAITRSREEGMLGKPKQQMSTT